MPSPIKKSRALTSLEESVLYALSCNQRYGLEIIEALNTGRPFAPVQSGSLYPAIQRLLEKGYITHTYTLTLPDAPDRIYYRISPSGRKILELLEVYRQNLP